MPRSSRADFNAWLAQLGVDTGGGGFPWADGVQPVYDLGAAHFAPRRLYAADTGLVGAPGAGLHNQIRLQVQVPTLLHWIAFDSATNGTTAALEFTEFVGLGTLVASTSNDGSAAINQVSLNTPGAVAALPGWQVTEGGITAANSIGHAAQASTRPIFVPPGIQVRLGDPTANALTFFAIHWEEQFVPSVG